MQIDDGLGFYQEIHPQNPIDFKAIIHASYQLHVEHEFPTIVLLEYQVNHDWYEKNKIPVRDIAGEGSDTVS